MHPQYDAVEILWWQMWPHLYVTYIMCIYIQVRHENSPSNAPRNRKDATESIGIHLAAQFAKHNPSSGWYMQWLASIRNAIVLSCCAKRLNILKMDTL
uniref:Uncharacterized protein n=1 Tax=Glossina palpalis gambiensis TaxID=67801 RepID=A0A1B0B556_9MUSC